LFALSLLGGCPGRDLGSLDKSDPEIDEALGVGVPEPPVNPPPVPPDPFQPGDERLSVGYFYEGGWSKEIPINTVTTNYFIFVFDENRVLETLTYSQTDSSDRIEGLISVEITLNDFPFWGGGIIWEEPTDLSGWTTMFVAFKSSDASFASFDLKLQYQRGETPPNEPTPELRSQAPVSAGGDATE